MAQTQQVVKTTSNTNIVSATSGERAKVVHPSSPSEGRQRIGMKQMSAVVNYYNVVGIVSAGALRNSSEESQTLIHKQYS